jgi:uncharacterized membrane protein YphA (DoxX/SURF4 family)
MKNKLPGMLSLILRLIAAGVFLYAGWQKLKVPQDFADNIAAYQLLPSQLINLTALALPPLELIIGFLLLIGWQRRVAAFAALILMGIFAAALGSAIMRGLTIDCGCFGAGVPTKNGLWLALLRDLIMWAGLLYVYMREIGPAGNGVRGNLANKDILSQSAEART